jgi:hypothetical protein
LWHCWKPLPAGEKLRAFFGTIRRVLTRRLYRRLQLDIRRATPVGRPMGQQDRTIPR